MQGSEFFNGTPKATNRPQLTGSTGTRSDDRPGFPISLTGNGLGHGGLEFSDLLVKVAIQSAALVMQEPAGPGREVRTGDAWPCMAAWGFLPS